jgi:hypothetical protein
MNVSKVEHFIYGPTPKKGYSKRARSTNINPDEYERLIGYYIPMDPSYVKSDDMTRSEARVVASVPAMEAAYFSKIFRREKLDEKGRTGILTHTLIINRSDLVKGLSYEDVDQAMTEFEEKNGIPIGDMPQLEINWEERPMDEEISKVRNLISKDSVKRLMDGYIKDPTVKFVITCKGSEQRDRIRLGYSLSKFLDLKLKVVPISFMTEPPLSMATSRCNMIISKTPLALPQKGWRGVSSLVDGLGVGAGQSSSELGSAMLDKIYS